MAIGTGKYVKATVGGVTVSDLNNISLNNEAPLVIFEAFGDEETKVAGTGIRSTVGSISGALNVDDTLGQNVIQNACISGTSITDFKVYVNATDYWESNTVADAAAHCRFTNYNITAPSPSETVTVSFDYSFSGKTHFVQP